MNLVNNTLTVGYRSESGHYLYFKNTDNAWNAVYLRIGRSDHVYTEAFTRIGDSDWWQCETPDYFCYTTFTIIDNSDATAPVTTCPSGSNRLYKYEDDITGDYWYTLGDYENTSGSDGSRYWTHQKSSSSLADKHNITANKYVFYDNTQTQWENVYLRVGRSDAVGMSKHCATYPFTRIGETNYWYLSTSTYNNLQAWTITNTDDNNGDSHTVYDLPANAERLYYYETNINTDVYYKATGTAAQGTSATGVNYWANTSTQDSYTVYLVPEELFGANWNASSVVKLEVEYLHVGESGNQTKEVAMSPVSEGSHIYEVTFQIPFPMAYTMNFKRYQGQDYKETYAVFYNEYKSADVWNGKIFSRGQNDARATEWFPYPKQPINSTSGHTIIFDNTKTAWEQPYLRIGRTKAHGFSNNHMTSYAFTQIGTSNLWSCSTPDYTEAEAWTITNTNQTGDIAVFASEVAVQATMQRVFYYRADINGDILVTATGDAKEGDDPFEVPYWGSTKEDGKPSFTIRFMNGEEELQSSSVTCGETPSYAGATPAKEHAEYSYSFVDWSPAIAPATEDVTYTATFNLDGYSRNVTSGNYGTICLPKAAESYTGAVMFQLVDKTADDGIIIEEVDAMEAGKPYIFLADADQVNVTFTGDTEDAQTVNGLVGYIGNEDLILEPEGENRYILAYNKIWMVDEAITMKSNRAYIDMSQIASLPHKVGKRRYVINSKNAPTGIESSQELKADSQKLIMNGQLIIIRNQSVYNAQGQLIQ
ncbi:MAG: hypothetical protein II457_02930 [Paludibacteraceae bacterium]|nr:hypothetical protein [Paludibacteraceae bacterium]